jgi:hypothetical protein
LERELAAAHLEFGALPSTLNPSSQGIHNPLWCEEALGVNAEMEAVRVFGDDLNPAMHSRSRGTTADPSIGPGGFLCFMLLLVDTL